MLSLAHGDMRQDQIQTDSFDVKPGAGRQDFVRQLVCHSLTHLHLSPFAHRTGYSAIRFMLSLPKYTKIAIHRAIPVYSHFSILGHRARHKLISGEGAQPPPQTPLPRLATSFYTYLFSSVLLYT